MFINAHGEVNWGVCQGQNYLCSFIEVGGGAWDWGNCCNCREQLSLFPQTVFPDKTDNLGRQTVSIDISFCVLTNNGWARLNTCVGVHGCGNQKIMSRIILNLPSTSSLRHGLSVRPEFINMASLASQFALGILYFNFWSWNYKWTTLTTQHLHGFRGSELCSSGLLSRHLTTEPSPQSRC